VELLILQMDGFLATYRRGFLLAGNCSCGPFHSGTTSSAHAETDRLWEVSDPVALVEADTLINTALSPIAIVSRTRWTPTNTPVIEDCGDCHKDGNDYYNRHSLACVAHRCES
jgi:hypothetical protein